MDLLEHQHFVDVDSVDFLPLPLLLLDAVDALCEVLESLVGFLSCFSADLWVHFHHLDNESLNEHYKSNKRIAQISIKHSYADLFIPTSPSLLGKREPKDIFWCRRKGQWKQWVRWREEVHGLHRDWSISELCIFTQ